MRWLSLLAGGLLAPIAWGQTTNSTPTSDRDGRVLQSTTASAEDGAPSSAIRPERPEQQPLSLDLRERLVSFEKVRETYLAEQRELLRKLRGATDEDRDRIREQIKTSREAWLEQARRFREEARERMIELKAALPGHKEALDAARDNAREKLKEARDRRGTD